MIVAFLCGFIGGLFLGVLGVAAFCWYYDEGDEK